MQKDSRFWQSRLIFLKNKTGEEIVDFYNKLVQDPNKDIIASQIFPYPNECKFDAFIYSKEKFGEIKGIYEKS